MPHVMPRTDRQLVALFAIAGGLAMANFYYLQPLLDTVAHDIGLTPAAAGQLVTVANLGFVIGLLVVVPLGDITSRRGLTCVLLLVSAAALALAAMADSFLALAGAMLAIGGTSVAAQVLVPYAAMVASEAERGKVVGAVMTGLMLGTLMSRSIAGAIAEVIGWRGMYGVAAALMVVLALVLQRRLPAIAPAAAMSYGVLLRSAARMFSSEPVLRRRAAYGAITFAVFNAFWTTVAFLLAGPSYGYADAAIGAVALVGLPSAFIAPYAGHLADRGHGGVLTGVYLVLLLVGTGLALVGGWSLVALLVGGFVVAFTVGCVHVTNQSLIYRLDPAARSRLTTAYMATYFLGGMGGSALAAALYGRWGWTAVTVGAAVLTTIALVGWLLEQAHLRSGAIGVIVTSRRVVAQPRRWSRHGSERQRVDQA